MCFVFCFLLWEKYMGKYLQGTPHQTKRKLTLAAAYGEFIRGIIST